MLKFIAECFGQFRSQRNRELKTEAATYQIEKLIGEGLTASVYKAFRADSRGHSRQVVALKVLKNRKEISCLKSEFELLAKIDSPNCVRVLGWENLENGSALALEWIEGATLLDLARFARLDDFSRASLIDQIYQGLAALTEHGLCHGDLSPANVLVDRKGVVRIVDFGESNRKESPLIVGTPAYIAPEVWQGARVSHQSDLFSLGLIERDLGTSFREVSNDPDVCRQRASLMATAEHSLLARAPEARCYSRKFGPSELSRGQEQLADRVSEFLNWKEGASVATAVMGRQWSNIWPQMGPKIWPLLQPSIKGEFFSNGAALLTRLASISSSLLLVSSLSIAPVKAQAPIRPRTPLSASLAIHSHRWLWIEINGTPVGYTPLTVKKLLPGTHRIVWRTRSNRGEKRIQLKPGQRLVLTEKELNSSNPLR